MHVVSQKWVADGCKPLICTPYNLCLAQEQDGPAGPSGHSDQQQQGFEGQDVKALAASLKRKAAAKAQAEKSTAQADKGNAAMFLTPEAAQAVEGKPHKKKVLKE
jgi:hypothetical protein